MADTEEPDDDLTTRVHSLVVSYADTDVNITISLDSEDEALDLAQHLVRHFKEYGAVTIEVMQRGGTLQ